MFLAAIEVEFNPHWADVRMLWLTAGSIAVSGLLGFLAFWNGRKATTIAQQASDRDEYRIHLEDEKKDAAVRREVALAIIRAVSAVKTLCETPRRRYVSGPNIESNPRHDEAAKAADNNEKEALALISLLPSTMDPSLIRSWFSHILIHFYGFYGNQEVEETDSTKSLDLLLSRVSDWAAASEALSQMISTDFEGPLDTDQGVDFCSGNTFPK